MIIALYTACLCFLVTEMVLNNAELSAFVALHFTKFLVLLEGSKQERGARGDGSGDGDDDTADGGVSLRILVPVCCHG